MEILPFLLAPFLASLILTGIHAYLGVHVVERGVIFVDLALAQIAALGATIAILIGMDPHGVGAYWLSLGFTFVGAAVFAFARTRRGHIPQEAFIGIAYAVASATAILAMSKATGETAVFFQGANFRPGLGDRSMNLSSEGDGKMFTRVRLAMGAAVLAAGALVGGMDKSFALQPLSLEGMQGLNVAAGIASMTLKHEP